MLVRDRMSRHPITVAPNTPVTEALELVRQNGVGCLPVLNQEGQLLGVVSEEALLHATPSPLTCLSVYKIHYLLSRVKAKDVMVRAPITVGDDCPLEEAVRLIVKHKVSGLPVTRSGEFVGIITEADLFKALLEMLGSSEQGLRLILAVPNKPGVIAAMIEEVTRLGGNIASLDTFHGQDRTQACVTMKVQGVPKAVLLPGLEKLGGQVWDVRDDHDTPASFPSSALCSRSASRIRQGLPTV